MNNMRIGNQKETTWAGLKKNLFCQPCFDHSLVLQGRWDLARSSEST